MAVEAGLVADKAKLELHKQHSVCLVLDYGSQYTQLIGRRVRSLNVYSMLKPGDISLVSAVACLPCSYDRLSVGRLLYRQQKHSPRGND